MNDYSQEKWIELYQSAILELKHSLMAGRIRDARAEIAKRIEKLKGIPGLHSSERQAIEDALNALNSLERMEEQDQQRAAAESALERLSSVAPRIERLNKSEEG